MKKCNCGTEYNIKFYRECPSCNPRIIEERWERQERELERKIEEANQYRLRLNNKLEQKSQPISHKTDMMIRLLDSDYQYPIGYHEHERFN